MGFFKNLISKFPCELCGNEVGALSRTKLKDEKYICFDCMKNCSTFYPAVTHTLEEVKAHMEYMKNMDNFCKEVFDKNTNKLDFALLFSAAGIIFEDDLGMFEIVTSDTKKKNYRELFRYDQIMDFKLYGKENTGENVTKKYSEVGIKIKMLNQKEKGLEDMMMPNMEGYKHEYVTEFTIPVAKSVDALDGGLILKHLDEIFNSYNGTSNGRTEYRKLDEIERIYNRNKWKEIADNAEKAFFGKTIKEM